jgi:hypothetical protein
MKNCREEMQMSDVASRITGTVNWAMIENLLEQERDLLHEVVRGPRTIRYGSISLTGSRWTRGGNS